MSSAAEEQGIRIPKPANQRHPTVSWSCKEWHQFTEADKAGLKAHLETFDNELDRDTYKQYLNFACGVPADFLELRPGAIWHGKRNTP